MGDLFEERDPGKEREAVVSSYRGHYSTIDGRAWVKGIPVDTEEHVCSLKP